MIGCSDAIVMDAAPELDRWENARRLQRSYQKPQKPRPLAAARAEDQIPPGTCRRCGFVGNHPTAAACISALRDRLAELE